MEIAEMLKQPTAVIVVDVQNDFCHPEGSMARRGARLTPAVDTVVDRTQALIDLARRRAWPVFFIRTEHSAWSDSRPWRERMKLGASIAEMPICEQGGWGAEFYRLTPGGDDRVVIKHRYNAFMNTDLDQSLRARGIDTVLVTGVTTNTCVESTARDAFMRDYWTITVGDCCAAPTVEEHESGLRNLGRYFGAVSEVAEIERLSAAN